MQRFSLVTINFHTLTNLIQEYKNKYKESINSLQDIYLFI